MPFLERDEFFNFINNMLNKTILNELSENISIQLWQDSNKTIIHLINYNFDLNKGIIVQKNITISINIPDKDLSKITILSPDSENNEEMTFNNTITIPVLKTWNILIIQ